MQYNDFEDSGLEDLLQGVEMVFMDTSFATICFLGDWVIENLYNSWLWISAAFNNLTLFLIIDLFYVYYASTSLISLGQPGKDDFSSVFSIFLYNTFSFP